MRHSMLTPNALAVAALVTFLAGCSGGSSQTPAVSGSATTLRPLATNTSHGFMQALGAQTHLVYMSSWGRPRGFYGVEFESAPQPDSEMPYRVVGKFDPVSREELLAIIAKHLGISR